MLGGFETLVNCGQAVQKKCGLRMSAHYMAIIMTCQRLSLLSGQKRFFYPDIMTLHERLMEQGHLNQLVIAEQMIHAYAIFPIREARQARKQIAELILKKE